MALKITHYQLSNYKEKQWRCTRARADFAQEFPTLLKESDFLYTAASSCFSKESRFLYIHS